MALFPTASGVSESVSQPAGENRQVNKLII